MKNQKIMKVFVFGTALMFLFIGLISPVSGKNFETIIIETKPYGSNIGQKEEISITSNEFESFMYDYNELINQNFSGEELIEKALELFRENGILCESATLDNLKESAFNVKNRLIKEKISKPTISSNGRNGGPSIIPGDFIFGLGCTFILATFMNTIAPFPYPSRGTAIPFINKTIEIPFLNQTIPIGLIGTFNPLIFDLLVGQSINFGWIRSVIPLNDKIILQPFYAILIFPMCVSFTVYTNTNPPITLFDCIVGASAVGNFLPFQTSWEE